MKRTLIVFTITHVLLVPFTLAKPKPSRSNVGRHVSYQSVVNMLRQNNYQGAMDAAKQLINKNPKDEAVHSLLGRAAIHLKNNTMAMKHLSRSIKLNADNPTSYYFRAMILAKAQKSKAALRDLKRATKFAPKNWAYWVELSRCYARLGHEAEAEASMKTAETLSPKNPIGWHKLGAWYWHDGHIKIALDAWKKSIALATEKKRPRRVWRVHFRLGQYHQSAGDLESAVVHYNAVLRTRPRHTRVLETMIQIHNQQGLYTQADTFRTRYLEQRRGELRNIQLSRTPKRRRTANRTFRVDQFRFEEYDILTYEFVNRRKAESIYTFFLNRAGTLTGIISLEVDADQGFNLVFRDNKGGRLVQAHGINEPPPAPPPPDPGKTLKTYSQQPTYPDVKRDVIAALQKGL